MEAVFFYLLGGLAVLGGVAFVTRREAIPAAVWLIFCFLNVAGLFALLSAHLIAALQILLYAGAIMVFFLFVIMLLGKAPRLARPTGWPLLVLGLGTIAAAALVLVGLMRRVPNVPLAPAPDGFGVAAVSDRLLTQYLFQFEATGLLLLVAVIGAVFLARRAVPQARPRPKRVVATRPGGDPLPEPAHEPSGSGHDAGAPAHGEVSHV